MNLIITHTHTGKRGRLVAIAVGQLSRRAFERPFDGFILVVVLSGWLPGRLLACLLACLFLLQTLTTQSRSQARAINLSVPLCAYIHAAIG